MNRESTYERNTSDVPPPPEAPPSPAGLRRRLVLLVLLAVLPALALVGISALGNRNTLARQVEENALRLARLAAAGHESAIEGARQFLTALAQAPEVRSADTSRCEPLVKDLLAGFPNYLNVGMADAPKGDVICTAVPSQTVVNVGDRTYFRQALATASFAVGDFIIGRITGEPSLGFGIPVRDTRGRIHAVAFAALKLDTFERIAVEADLPSGSAVVVLDGGGTILARTPDDLGLVGKRLPESELVRAVVARTQGAVEVAGLDGVRRLYGFTRLRGGGEVSVAVGISTKAAFADVNRTFWLAIAGLAVVGVLALVAAWIVGTNLIVRPVTAAFARERDAVDRLEKVDQMRTDFVSMVSHELRNPLATIRGFGQLLRDRPESLPGEQRVQAYDAIVRQVDRMAALVDNVLDVSRLESDSFTYAFISYDPNRLVAECVEEARASWPAHEIVLDGVGRVPTAMGDPDRLKQVVMNLLSNACRYSPEGNPVTVRTASGDASFKIDVADRGAGISQENLGNLFGRFARLRTPDTQKVRGTGLGLYISRRIVEAHGGRILVDSEVGRGSTFTLELPVTPPQQPG